LFATSLFLAIAIQILLRRDVPSRPPSQRKAKLFVVHIALVSGLLVAGFIVLDLVLMQIGQSAVGIIGIVFLCLIAGWIGIVWYAESTEMLEDKGCGVVENQQSAAKEET
jgi:hypothetical protein